MGWHRDLRINYDDLNGIYNEIKKYIDALTDLQIATSKFVSVINEQEGDSFVALSEECKDIVTVNNTDLIKTLQEVYDNLGGYMTDMQAIIAPENSAIECRVDRNDIWWNKDQIKGVINSAEDNIIVPMGTYFDLYVDPDADNADEIRAENERRRRCRENNYNKLESFKNNLTATYIPNLEIEMTSINSIYDNNVVVYENTDDAYSEKMDDIYDSIKTWLDMLGNGADFLLGLGKGILFGVGDFLKGAKPFLEIAAAMYLPMPFGMRVLLLADGAREIYQGVKIFIEDPQNVTGAIFQGLFDTADEEGLAFTIGYSAEKIVEVFLLKKAGKIAEAEYVDDFERINVAEEYTRLYSRENLLTLNNTENLTESAVEHIFEGQINGRGNAVGYHYECIEDTVGTVVPGTEVPVNDLGVYKAQVEVNGVPKTGNAGFSTFFPKEMSPQEVVDAINEAYKVKVLKSGNQYYGYANNGMKITMYINKDGKIISAFPTE